MTLYELLDIAHSPYHVAEIFVDTAPDGTAQVRGSFHSAGGLKPACADRQYKSAEHAARAVRRCASKFGFSVKVVQ